VRIATNQQVSTICVFLNGYDSIEAVPADLYERVMTPRVGLAGAL
jgi:hypothetical protein